MRLVVVVVALVLALGLACAPVAGPVAVEVLVRDDDVEEGYGLATVTLASVTDLFAGKGELFDFRASEGFYATPTFDEAELDGWSERELWDASRSDGSELKPDLYFDGERWVARDFDSLHYLTAFYNLEQAFLFMRDELALPSGATDVHAHVGFHGMPFSSRALPVPVVLGDNAAYAPTADMFLVVPVINQTSGVPPFMDVGVATHEFHHRAFFHRVMVRDDVMPLFKRYAFPAVYKQEELSGSDPTELASALYTDEEVRVLNQLRGVDEGLADVFATGMTGDPDVLRAFAPEISPLRSLEGELLAAADVSYADLEDGALPDHLLAYCAVNEAGDNFAVLGMNYYCLGTLLAASLWQAARHDVDVFRAEILPAVELALDDVGDRIAAASPAGGPLTFDVGMALDAIAAHTSGAVHVELCATYAARFERVLARGGAPSCE